MAATSLAPEDQLSMRALIHETCAEAAAALGELSMAGEHRRETLELHRAKGNAVSVARLQGLTY